MHYYSLDSAYTVQLSSVHRLFFFFFTAQAVKFYKPLKVLCIWLTRSQSYMPMTKSIDVIQFYNYLSDTIQNRTALKLLFPLIRYPGVLVQYHLSCKMLRDNIDL